MLDSLLTATAVSCANIALIKYWGNRDAAINLPSNGSISMNLDGLYTRIQISFYPTLETDSLKINEKPAPESMRTRMSQFLDKIRGLAGITYRAMVDSSTNIPIGTGIASSAAAFAALSLAATKSLGLSLTETELSRLARLGSGSACRSIPEGFVEWEIGTSDHDSFAHSIAPANHWALCDCIAIIQTGSKKVSSHDGHILATSSPLQAARLADSERRLALCREAILQRDFFALAEVAELDSNLMHAVMMTSNPSLLYWEPASLKIIKNVPLWRSDGLPVFFTLDAGPNVHVICTDDVKDTVKYRILEMGIPEVIQAGVGGPTRIIRSI